MPRKRRPPARYTGPAAAHTASTAAEFYKPQFYELLDAAVSELDERFSGSNGLQMYGRLEAMLLTGTLDSTMMQQYSEIHPDTLALELAMFRRTYTEAKLSDAVTALRAMSPDMRKLFQQVETLVRLLLVCPCSSVEAERSFSALRRLKTCCDRPWYSAGWTALPFATRTKTWLIQPMLKQTRLAANDHIPKWMEEDQKNSNVNEICNWCLSAGLSIWVCLSVYLFTKFYCVRDLVLLQTSQ